MSTTTPEQLRAIAAVAQVSLATVGDGDWNPQDSVLERAMLALRDAADEVERLRASTTNNLPEKVFVVVGRQGEPTGAFVDWYDAIASADESKQGRVVVVGLQ